MIQLTKKIIVIRRKDQTVIAAVVTHQHQAIQKRAMMIVELVKVMNN